MIKNKHHTWFLVSVQSLCHHKELLRLSVTCPEGQLECHVDSSSVSLESCHKNSLTSNSSYSRTLYQASQFQIYSTTQQLMGWLTVAQCECSTFSESNNPTSSGCLPFCWQDQTTIYYKVGVLCSNPHTKKPALFRHFSLYIHQHHTQTYTHRHDPKDKHNHYHCQLKPVALINVSCGCRSLIFSKVTMNYSIFLILIQTFQFLAPSMF